MTSVENHLKGSDFTTSALRALAASIACCLVLASGGCSKEKPAPPPPPTVEVTTVTVQDVPIYKEWIGALDGNINAVIRPQVTGYLVKQNYREGELVKKGQVLFEIDPRTFKASLDQAKGQLAQQQARYDTSKANLARIKPLAAKNAVSQKDLDDATGSELSARSSVETAQAALENAQLNLSFTKITSPVDGIAGIAKTQLGNLVGPSSTQELTTVSSVNPIKAFINVSEREYLEGRESNQNVENIPLELILADGSVYPHKGKFSLADRQVDQRILPVQRGEQPQQCDAGDQHREDQRRQHQRLDHAAAGETISHQPDRCRRAQ